MRRISRHWTRKTKPVERSEVRTGVEVLPPEKDAPQVAPRHTGEAPRAWMAIYLLLLGWRPCGFGMWKKRHKADDYSFTATYNLPSAYKHQRQK